MSNDDDRDQPSASNGSRFANKLARDPRFRREPARSNKVVIDDRFKRMYKDEAFVRPVSVDRYGRSVGDKNKGVKDLKRFYRLENEEQEGEKSESETIESSSLSEVSESEDEAEETEMVPAVQEPEAVPLGDATCRLAVVNMDWDQIKAVDLFVLFNGFKPVGSQLLSVCIYKSEFGREQLAREAREGPDRSLFTSPYQEEEEESEEEEDDLMREEDASEDFDGEKLRKYQLQRMRYYFAVVECDSVEAAAQIYQQCDSREFETSSNILDLRYIPESVEFSAEDLRDEATALPGKYRPKPDMVTAALQMSRVGLTWDEDDPDRKRLIESDFSRRRDPLNRKKKSAESEDEADLEAYLASSSSDDDDECNDKTSLREKLMALSNDARDNVFDSKAAKNRSSGLDISFPVGFGEHLADDGDAASDVDREAVFDSDEIPSQAEDQDSKPLAKEETHFEKILRLRREKKQTKKETREARRLRAEEEQRESLQRRDNQKKKRSLLSSDDESQESDHHKENSEGKKERSRLKLLLLDENDSNKKHFNMDRLDAKKATKKTIKRDDTFDLDTEDSRFKQVFEDPSYAINPTDPHYRATPAMQKLLKKRQERLVSNRKPRTQQ